MSGLQKLILGMEAWEGNTVFISKSAVDEELSSMLRLSGSSLYPTSHLLGRRIIVVPDVLCVDTVENDLRKMVLKAAKAEALK